MPTVLNRKTPKEKEDVFFYQEEVYVEEIFLENRVTTKLTKIYYIEY